MTNAAPSLRASNAPSRGATAPAFGVDRDLESELMAGLSGPVRKRAKALASVAEDATDKETADADAPLPEALEAPRAAIDAGLEAALIEGLSDPTRERAETLASAAAIPADAERADADAPLPEAFEAPRAGIDAGLEAALMESLSGPVRERAETLASAAAILADEETADAAAAPPEPSEGPDPVADALPGPRNADDETIADLSAAPPNASQTPGAAIGAGLEAALIGGLPGPAEEMDAAPDPAFAEVEPARMEAVATARARDSEVADTASPDASRVPGAAIDASLEAALIGGLPGSAEEVDAAADPASGGREIQAEQMEVVAAASDPEVPDAAPPDASQVSGAAIDTGLEAALIGGLPGPAEEVEAPPDASQIPGTAVDADLEAALTEDLSGPTPEGLEAPAVGPLAADLETVFAEAPGAHPADMESWAAATPEVSEGPIAALAFALDPDTEAALHEALSELDRSPTEGGPPMVWRGGLQAAIAALAEGHSTPLLLVDVDETPYPAGALHKLSTVCDVGTIVIAIGSNATAQASREVLLAGVSDYLTKPVTAAAVSEAIAHALRAETAEPRSGRVAGFLGVGGSGATTLAAATAVHASGSGYFVSILDLNRMVPSAALMLDVEPAPGLDQLLEAAGRSSPDPEIIDAIRTERSARLAVYAYRSSESLPRLAEKPALMWLIAELRRRSHLVLIDGVDDLDLQLALLDSVDTPVLVAEPSTRDAGRAGRLIEALGSEPPVILVQNQTRKSARGADALAPVVSGSQIQPDFVVPFEPSLSRVADQSWPQGRVPRSMTKPLAALVDRILSPALAAGSDAAMHFERS